MLFQNVGPEWQAKKVDWLVIQFCFFGAIVQLRRVSDVEEECWKMYVFEEAAAHVRDPLSATGKYIGRQWPS